MQDSKRMTLYDNDLFKVDLEYNEEFVILHIPYIQNMGKETLSGLKKKLDDCAEFFKVCGYEVVWAAIEKEDYKMKKLLFLLNFSFKGSDGPYDVYLYEGAK